jgi:putative transposase
VKYAFIQDHEGCFRTRRMCTVLGVHPSGYYAWRREGQSARSQEDGRLLGLIREAWDESAGVYGYRKVHRDLREAGESCGVHRVERLMRDAGLSAQRGYGRRRRTRSPAGAISAAAPNRLQRAFDVDAPDRVWVTDITYLRTLEGWLYLAVVVDLFARTVVGWSMQSRLHTDLAASALLMALRRRAPDGEVMVHSDQGVQFTSHLWQELLKDNRLLISMSRRGNCHDNAVAESFFQLLKRERVRNRVYPDRDSARADVFDYIEMFYNPRRRHSHAGGMAPLAFERLHFNSLASV